MRVPRKCIRVEAPDKRVGGEEVVEQVVADNRLEMDHLVCGEEVLLFEGEARVGQYQVGADDAPPPEAFGQHQDGDRNGPDVPAAGHDEEVEVAAALEIQMSDAA